MKRKTSKPPAEPKIPIADFNSLEFFEERAAMREFDGGQTREQAESAARYEAIARSAKLKAKQKDLFQ